MATLKITRTRTTRKYRKSKTTKDSKGRRRCKTCVIDGCIYDTFNCGDRIMRCAWKVE